MDPITIIGLIFAIIKGLMELIAFLQAHPAITAEAKAVVAKAGAALEEANTHMETAKSLTIADKDQVEAP